MVEAEWSAADDRASRKRRVAARGFGMEVAHPTNMYSALTLQLPANGHSMPPPTVPVVTVFDTEVEVSQLPQPGDVCALIEHRCLYGHEGGATLDVK